MVVGPSFVYDEVAALLPEGGEIDHCDSWDSYRERCSKPKNTTAGANSD